MAKFPKREGEVQIMAHKMITGYTENPTIFTHADIAGLQATLTAYETSKDDQDRKVAVAQIATEHKDIALAAMEAKMHDQLRQSEVDTASDAELLELIGWGPRATPTPTTAPGQVRFLEAVMQGPGTLHLDWKAPQAGTGGPVRAYRIDRREATGPGSMSDWHEAGIAFETEVLLTNQTRGLQMEYRVVAVNGAGDGVPSNTVDIVL